MQNPRLASRYAKSLMDISVEQNSLDETLQDVQLLDDVCGISREFCVMLRSPVINADKKEAAISAVFGGKLKPLTLAFINLLIKKGREAFLPEIAPEFIKQYKNLKSIRTVTLTTALPIDESVKETIRTKVAAGNPDYSIDMQVKVDPELIGGFMLEMGDKLVDASVRRDLAEIKKSFLDKSYMMQIR
jgi:F-type H+-transporting ATPase subunit delta